MIKPKFKSSKDLNCKCFQNTNFECLYDSFHQPLTNIISNNDGIIGINTKGELKRLELNEESKIEEAELSKYAKMREIKLLDLRLNAIYARHNETISDQLKYILFFYKVGYINSIGSFRIHERRVRTGREKLSILF